MNPESKPIIAFAEFELDIARRRLLRSGEPLALNAKAFDLLTFLAENAGRILTKEEILDAVWENQFIEEANLTVQISTLRKALGDSKDNPRFLATVPGKGYKFVGDLNEKNDGDDFLLETHTLSRITIEEQEEVDEGGTLKLNHRVLKSNRVYLLLLPFVFLFLLFGGYYVWQKGRKANAAFQIASIKRLTTRGKVGVAALSPDGKLFVYSQRETGEEKESLWLGHVSGGEPVQILAPVEMSFASLTFTPDASSLYYSTDPLTESGALYRLPVFGGVPEKIRDLGASGISFAPDGKRFVFVREDKTSNKTSLIVANTENADERILANGDLDYSLNGADWSPDGKRIAVAAFSNTSKPPKAEIYLADVSSSDGGAAIKPLTAHGWNRILSVKWQADGSGLMTVANDKNSPAPHLWQISYPSGETSVINMDLNFYDYSFGLSADNHEVLAIQSQIQSNIWIAPAADLTNAKQLTFSSIGRSEGVAGINWTADGRLLYTATIDKLTTIQTMNADGKNQKQLIPTGGNNRSPGATANNRYIVFQSNRVGRFAIWRADANGENLVQISPVGDDYVSGEPTVSPDGKWVVYVSNSSSFGTLYRVSIDGGDPVQLADKPAAWATVSPDSQLIACGYKTDGNVKLAIFSINGGEPLKLFKLPRRALLQPGVRWLPDSKTIAYRDADNGIWTQSLDGGEPQRIKNLPPEKIYGFGWSPDGKLFAFTRGTEIRDAILITNVE